MRAARCSTRCASRCAARGWRGASGGVCTCFPVVETGAYTYNLTLAPREPDAPFFLPTPDLAGPSAEHGHWCHGGAHALDHAHRRVGFRSAHQRQSGDRTGATHRLDIARNGPVLAACGRQTGTPWGHGATGRTAPPNTI